MSLTGVSAVGLARPKSSSRSAGLLSGGSRLIRVLGENSVPYGHRAEDPIFFLAVSQSLSQLLKPTHV